MKPILKPPENLTRNETPPARHSPAPVETSAAGPVPATTKPGLAVAATTGHSSYMLLQGAFRILRLMTGLACGVAATGLAGCQYLSPPDLYARQAPPAQVASSAADDTSTHQTFSVLTYNVEGLAWPARTNRGPRLRLIADKIAAMRAAGTAPDIILLQEVFSREAIAIARRSGYQNAIPGPARSDKRTIARTHVDLKHAKNRRITKGERWFGKRAHSGLYILTDFPVVATASEPFSPRACAGYDCLANKGVAMVRLAIPQAGTHIDVFNTHLNSRRAAKVRLQRADNAHRYQVEEASEFLRIHREDRGPAIYGGDFNMRNAPRRFEVFAGAKPAFELVHRYCARNRGRCDVRKSWDGDEPWMDTQDLQLFSHGDGIELWPTRVDTMFDEPAGGKTLADHDGLLVTYELVRAAPSSSE
ncbi:MAG: endonuclease/exonuclease/phosphatase family protein [Parvibaculum sp.]|uniref:endonuclease/exonuclease/phosphatase family protein n=1 Tax=Parvibaculum sp. TaxID=2024848 RepID=UPI002AB9E2F0|nr:endonuclease/exonuclease/phosphatase family protein [Parvibaculum sp.]MDZ4382889.1 endonuclease/exonuclease/phosphatase family protein [Parvibaculum sp.]